MKRMMIAVVLLTLLLSVLAFAQQEPQKPPTDQTGKMGQIGKMGRMGMMQGMMRGEGGPAEAPMAFLKLTDEQRAKMQDLRLAHQKEILPLHSQLQKLHADLKLELTADKFNESKVKSIQGDISKVMNEIAMKTILHQRAVRDLLTPEQKKQFDSHILSGGMMGGGGPMGRGGRMGPGGPMGMAGGMAGPGMGECNCGRMK